MMKEAFYKVIAVLHSCRSAAHLLSALVMVERFGIMFGKNNYSYQRLTVIANEKLKQFNYEIPATSSTNSW